MEIQNYNTSEFKIEEVKSEEKPESTDSTGKNTNNETEVSNYKKQKVELKEKYSAVSKDGDTVLISKEGELEAQEQNGEDNIVLINNSKVQLSDAALSKLSKSKLRQLLSQHKISQQQYNKAIRK